MSDAVWFAVVFVGFFVLRAIAATWVFLFLLPRGDRCPNCDEVTLRIASRGWNRMLPWFRTPRSVGSGRPDARLQRAPILSQELAA
jgi:hypothetical protein